MRDTSRFHLAATLDRAAREFAEATALPPYLFDLGPAEGRERPGHPAAVAAVQQEFVSVIQRVLPSVVEIRTNAGLGSGVVLDADGDIVTNAHVVAGASSFQVLSATAAVSGSSASSSAPRPAVLVGSCPADDLAVIRVDADAGLYLATFANSASLTVGDIVLAIGSPLGLGGSVTEGIVSAIGRSVAEPASAGTRAAVLTDTIQTSAAINPGNSGGAPAGTKSAARRAGRPRHWGRRTPTTCCLTA